MQYFYLVTLCESLKLPRVQSFHQLLYPPHGGRSNCDHGLCSNCDHGSLSNCDRGLQNDGWRSSPCAMRIMVFKGIFIIVIMVSMVINITMIKISMVIMIMLFMITMSEWGAWSYSQSLLQPVCFTKEFYSVFLCLNMIYTNLKQIFFIRRSPSSPISLGRRSTTIRVLVNMLTLSAFKTRFLS